MCWVEIAVEETGIVPGWGGEGSEETENHHHKHLSVGHVEEEDRGRAGKHTDSWRREDAMGIAREKKKKREVKSSDVRGVHPLLHNYSAS